MAETFESFTIFRVLLEREHITLTLILESNYKYNLTLFASIPINFIFKTWTR
jgi:hypothetical protein